MQIDMSIRLGDIVTLLGILITFITWGNNIRWQVKNLEINLNEVKSKINLLTELTITASKLMVRLDNVEHRLDHLEHPSSGRKTHPNHD